MNEATIKDTEHGKVITSDGWFILNMREVAWQRSPHNGAWSSRIIRRVRSARAADRKPSTSTATCSGSQMKLSRTQ